MPSDLDALRAAVLMSRKAPTQHAGVIARDQTQQTLSQSDQTLANLNSTTNDVPTMTNTFYNTETAGSDLYPPSSSAMAVAAATAPALISAAGSDSAARTSNASHLSHVASTVPLSQTSSVDREDGEISDEESKGVRQGALSRRSAEKASFHSLQRVESDRINDSVVSEVSAALHPPPQPALTRPKAVDHSILAEQPLRRIRAKGKKSRDDVQLVAEQDPDFTTLMAEYQRQKAKTNNRLTSIASGTEHASDSDIPGLGLIKSTGRPLPEPQSSDRSQWRQHNSNDSNVIRRRSKSPRNDREARDPGRPSQDILPRNRDQPTPIQPTQWTQLAHQHHGMNGTSLLTAGLSEVYADAHRAPLQQSSSDTQVHILVAQLLDLGVGTDYLLQNGIDPEVVHHVSSEMNSRRSVNVSAENSHLFDRNIHTMAAVAYSQPLVPHPQPLASATVFQSYAPASMYQQHALLPVAYAKQDANAALLRTEQTMPSHQMQHMQPHLQNVPSSRRVLSHEEPIRQFDVMARYAPHIAPLEWQPSVRRDASSEATSVPYRSQGFAGDEPRNLHPIETPYQQHVTPHSARTIMHESSEDRRALSQEGSGSGSRSEQAGRHAARWNQSEEATVTTSRFQDLTISSSQQLSRRGTTAPLPQNNRNQSSPASAGLPKESLNNQDISASQVPPHSTAEASSLRCNTSAETSKSAQEKRANIPKATNTSEYTQTASGDSSVPLDLSTIGTEPITSSSALRETESTSTSTSSQDDMDMEMDMELDDGAAHSTILKGSWKTTAQRPPTTLKRPTHVRFDSVQNAHVLRVHSAPASITSTLTDSQVAGGRQSTAAALRSQPYGRRMTAMDMMSRSQPPVPFIQERSLSYLIDLDDEEDDEPGGYGRGSVNMVSRPSTPRSLAESSGGREQPKSLAAIQQELFELNRKIKARELARQNAAATKQVADVTPSQSVKPAISATHAQDRVPVIQSPSTHVSNDEMQELLRTLNEQTTSLEQLRSQLKKCQQDKDAATTTLSRPTASDEDDQSLEVLQGMIDKAQEVVARKARELEDAQSHLEKAKARMESLVLQTDEAQKARISAQKRVVSEEEKAIRIKESIMTLQQDMLRVRTRLMILEANAEQPPLVEEASHVALSKRAVDAGVSSSKRLASSTMQAPVPAAVKKPRLDAREQMSALTKRMQELEQEHNTLQQVSTVTPSDSLSSAPITRNNKQPPSFVSKSKAAAGIVSRLIASERHEPLPPTTLAKLDDFLTQGKTLPVQPALSPIVKSMVSRWRPMVGIKKLSLHDMCLFEVDLLCVPSSLISYVIPDHQSSVQVEAPLASTTSSVRPLPGRGASDYQSPLTMFRSFRFSDQFSKTASGGYRSRTYSNKIDPMKPMCIYELTGGACNDDKCKSQHERDYLMTDDDLLIDMARYAEGTTPEACQVFAEMQSARLAQLRAHGIYNVDLLADSIVKSHRAFVKDPTRTVKFGDRVLVPTSSQEQGQQENTLVQSGNRTVDRLISRAQMAHGNPLDQRSIVMSSLLKALSGASPKAKRYHEQLQVADYERLISRNPLDASIWIEYALADLSNKGSEEEMDQYIRQSLCILSRAVVAHPKSEDIWSLYLELYMYLGSEAETRHMFEEALQYVPDAQLIWFRYHLWEKSRDERVYVLDRMLERACQAPREADDEASRSRFTLDVVLQIIKNMVSENFVETAKNWTQNFLICTSWESVVPSSLSYAQLDDVWREQMMVENIAETLAARLLTANDLCVLWLAYLYLVWFHELPDQLFLDLPNHYLSDNTLFTIQWPKTEEPEQESDLHSIVHDIFLGLTSYFVDCDAVPSTVATLKNFIGFLMARGQQQEEILELLQPSNYPVAIPEIHDLLCQVHLQFNQAREATEDLKQALQASPTQPYLWNRYAQLLPMEAKMACLEQCALEFFEIDSGSQSSLDRSELALNLYQKLLGLDVPDSYQAPPTRLDTTPFKANVFLWLNYLSLLALGSARNNSYAQLEMALSSAMDILPAEKASIFKTEFAVHSIMKDLDKTLGLSGSRSVVAWAVKKLDVLKTNPYDHAVSNTTKVLPLKDFTQVNMAIENIWRHTAQGPTQQLRLNLLDAFLELYPDNISLYLRIMAIFSGSNSTQMGDFMANASLISPLADKLRRMPIVRAVSLDGIAQDIIETRSIQDSNGQGSGSDMEMDN
ncbi:Zinc finger C3H1 domain-containing protein [Mortierella claussenii]|nr:Zinc finger C3H1 domain-containing protein [Mortierella claussenii]